jgi:hypothetical protein
MYVVSALTLVCDAARIAYPWLHESVVEVPVAAAVAIRRDRHPVLANLLGVGWLQDLLALREAAEAAAPAHPPAGIPPLALPPPAGDGNDGGNS